MYGDGHLFYKKSHDGLTVYIYIRNKFDFMVQHDFREACESGKYSRYVIDLTSVSYMDSAALGMLMVLYRKANEEKGAIRLVGCCESVLQTLRIAHFMDFFDIPGFGDTLPEPA